MGGRTRAALRIGERLGKLVAVSEPSATAMIRRLPGLREIDRVEPLDGGFSPDEVLLAVTRGGARYVVRLADASLFDRKRAEARFLDSLRAAGLRCPRVVDVGIAPDDERCYTIFEYLEGTLARDALPSLSPQQQERAGRTAGEQLRLIHAQAPPLPESGWRDRRRAKHERKRQALEKLQLRFDGQDRVDAYLEASWALLEASPFRLQHDDFQPGNILIARGAYAGVIDFGNWDGGDPVEDFYKIPWLTAQRWPPFARGQIDGYLAAGESHDFWRRYHLFIALSLYSTLLWGAENGASLAEFETRSSEPHAAWLAGIAHILETHDFDGATPPRWYTD